MSLEHGTGLITDDGLVFTTLGRTWIGDEPLAVLTHYPDPDGDREFDGQGYSAVPAPLANHDAMVDALREIDEAYVRAVDLLDRRLARVPRDRIVTVRRPLASASPEGTDGSRFAALRSYLMERIDRDHLDVDIGATGAVLLGMDAADIDMVFHGGPAAVRQLQEVFAELVDDGALETVVPDRRRDLMAAVLDAEIDAATVPDLVRERRYIGAFSHAALDAVIDPVYTDTPHASLTRGEAGGRVTVEGTARTGDAVYGCPEFRVEGEREVYAVCYHRGGELVRDGDAVTMSGTLVEREGMDVLVQIDPEEDTVRVRKRT